MKHLKYDKAEENLLYRIIDFYLENHVNSYEEHKKVCRLKSKIYGRGMTIEEIKEHIDPLCLKSLNDDVDIEALQEWIHENIYDKGMGVSGVFELPLPKGYTKGQAIRFSIFYKEAYDAENGGLCPQDMPYVDLIIGGRK